jgi:hypothetical protein
MNRMDNVFIFKKYFTSLGIGHVVVLEITHRGATSNSCVTVSIINSIVEVSPINFN